MQGEGEYSVFIVFGWPISRAILFLKAIKNDIAKDKKRLPLN
jgi:hypothetical protein